jgi:hypothetical protein
MVYRITGLMIHKTQVVFFKRGPLAKLPSPICTGITIYYRSTHSNGLRVIKLTECKKSSATAIPNPFDRGYLDRGYLDRVP